MLKSFFFFLFIAIPSFVNALELTVSYSNDSEYYNIISNIEKYINVRNKNVSILTHKKAVMVYGYTLWCYSTKFNKDIWKTGLSIAADIDDIQNPYNAISYILSVSNNQCWDDGVSIYVLPDTIDSAVAILVAAAIYSDPLNPKERITGLDIVIQEKLKND